MSLSLEFRHQLKQIQCETPEQRLGLKQLLELTARLREPGAPNATRGLEGLLLADAFLKQRNAVGILVGSLVETVWNSKGKLGRHKDVDVLVTSPHFALKENFELGIDWWLPQIESLRVNYYGGYAENMKTQWWENGNDVALNFAVNSEAFNQLSPGLYFPHMNWYVDMRVCEGLPLIDPSVEGVIDEEVFEVFESKILDRVDRRFNNRLQEHFEESQITVPAEEAFDPLPAERETKIAINRFIKDRNDLGKAHLPTVPLKGWA